MRVGSGHLTLGQDQTVLRFHRISSKNCRVSRDLEEPMVVLFLKIEKQRLREVKCFALGHTAGSREIRSPNPKPPSSGTTLFPIISDL